MNVSKCEYNHNLIKIRCLFVLFTFCYNMAFIYDNLYSNQKVLFIVAAFYNSTTRAFQTDMHNKLHKLNTTQ
jgi:hypothetical protein